MSVLPFPYATDEDLAIRAPSEFTWLCPADQVLVAGSSGQFLPEDRWVLRDGTLDFSSSGLAPGQVIHLRGPAAQYPSPGELLVVSQVLASGVRLRRKGLADGTGSPPGPAAGVEGVNYLGLTLSPQIQRVGEELNRRFGIRGGMLGTAIEDPVTAQTLRDLAVLGVLLQRYLDLSQQETGPADCLAAKASRLAEERDALMARSLIHFGADGSRGLQPFVCRFSTQLSR
jgi:hypothetical protein